MSQTAQSKPGQGGQGGRSRGPPIYGRGHLELLMHVLEDLEENLK